MQLTYRGQSYDVISPALEAMPSAESARFLGQSYTRKQFNVVQHQQPSQLTYRGIHYAR